MKKEIVENGPITSKMLVFEDLATQYVSGIYSYAAESADHLMDNMLIGSHAVLIVGWGQASLETDPQATPTKFWIVKNSWGSDWGEDGYFKIRMGDCYLAQVSFEGAYACMPEIDPKQLQASF